MLLLQLNPETRKRVVALMKKFDILQTMIPSPSLFSFPEQVTYRSCITGDMRPKEAGGGGSKSGGYLNPYRGYDGSAGNNDGLNIPHRSKYSCSSNLRLAHNYIRLKSNNFYQSLQTAKAFQDYK